MSLTCLNCKIQNFKFSLIWRELRDPSKFLFLSLRMTKLRKYSRLCWWQGSHIARKGPNFSKTSTRGLWHTVQKKRVSRETQLPKYDPLLANPLWKLYWSRNYVYKKIQFYGLIFSKSFLLLIYNIVNISFNLKKARNVSTYSGLLVQSHFNPKWPNAPSKHFHVFYLLHFYIFCRGFKPVFYKLFLS